MTKVRKRGLSDEIAAKPVGGPKPLRPRAPTFLGLQATSAAARNAARGSSKKVNTRCELLLQHAVDQLGLRYAAAREDLPGRPDLVFPQARVVVFCDGDFWHGRNLRQRLKRLAGGNNAPYWTAKIKANVARDKRQTRALHEAGWDVLRFWESRIRADPDGAASAIERLVRGRMATKSGRRAVRTAD